MNRCTADSCRWLWCLQPVSHVWLFPRYATLEDMYKKHYRRFVAGSILGSTGNTGTLMLMFRHVSESAQRDSQGGRSRLALVLRRRSQLCTTLRRPS